VAFFPKSALALLLVVTPALAMAKPLPPLSPSTSGSSSAVGGPHRPQVFHPYVEVARLDRNHGGGPRRPQVFHRTYVEAASSTGPTAAARAITGPALPKSSLKQQATSAKMAQLPQP
jgi:hypothetical protein